MSDSSSSDDDSSSDEDVPISQLKRTHLHSPRNHSSSDSSAPLVQRKVKRESPSRSSKSTKSPRTSKSSKSTKSSRLSNGHSKSPRTPKKMRSKKRKRFGDSEDEDEESSSSSDSDDDQPIVKAAKQIKPPPKKLSAHSHHKPSLMILAPSHRVSVHMETHYIFRSLIPSNESRSEFQCTFKHSFYASIHSLNWIFTVFSNDLFHAVIRSLNPSPFTLYDLTTHFVRGLTVWTGNVGAMYPRHRMAVHPVPRNVKN